MRSIIIMYLYLVQNNAKMHLKKKRNARSEK